jgi:hypothetical protein
MTEQPEEPLSETERRALHALHEDLLPPPALEDRVILELKGHGLLRAQHAGSRWRWRAAITLAASLAVFLIGMYVGIRTTSPVPRPGGAQFVFFLVEGESFRAPLSGEEEYRIAEYRNWAHHLGESGIRLSGEKLKEGEAILGSSPSRQLSAGAGADGGVGSLGGYFIVEAKNLEQARKIASTCPHLLHGGRLIIRQIDPT